MKRLLLFSIVLAFTSSLLAQTAPKYVAGIPSLFPSQISADPVMSLNSTSSKSVAARPSFSTLKKISTRSVNVNFYKLASSGNANSVLHSQSTGLSADPSLNLIMFTHRACNYYVNHGGNSGWINTSFSTDGGATWDTSVIPVHVGGTTTDTACRYPSGIIFNPAGNLTANKTYGVVSGPYTDNTNWVGYYFGSARLDSSNFNQQIYPIVDTPVTYNEYWPNIATTAAGKYVYVLGVRQYISTSTTTRTFYGAVLNKGTFDTLAKTFTWTQTYVPIPVAIKPQDALLKRSTLEDTAQYTIATSSTDMAWSADGSIGYIVQFGVDSAQLAASSGIVGYYPIVYKSSDSGKTWTKIPYNPWDTTTAITQLLITSKDGHQTPFIGAINGSKCLVDYNNNLHIISDIESGYSNNPDSLLSYYIPASGYILPQFIFDLSTSDGSSWTTTLVDSILSQAGTSSLWTVDANPNDGGVYVDARIQAALTPDRTKAFITWIDSDPTETGLPNNDYPDIFSKGLDYTNNYRTPTVNFTSSSNDAESCYWLYVSPTAFDSSGTYTIPATISLPQSSSADYTDNPVEHYYVSGIQFTDSDFSATGISGIARIANSNLGLAIYPNPSNGNFNIAFTKYTGVASLFITNILGTTVKQINNVNVNSNNLQLDLSDLVSGIYFLRVETAQGSETQKIVIANKN